ncbi:MAG: hypothetical protein ACKVP5_15255 [Aestuariivirga sp.]
MLAAGQFVANATGLAGDSDDRFAYQTTSGRRYFDADGNGAGARVLVATLIGTPALALDDIVIV